ncbi:MAG: hypothetical protein ACLGH4_02365 [Actinomycetes bacterium]
MRGSTRAARHAAVVVTVGVLAACSSAGTGRTADDPPATVEVPASTPTAGTAQGPTEPADEDHAELEVPATSSGPLTRRDFPRPRELGPQWRYRVDQGDAEEGYAGNSTPVLERDPTEVAALAVPFGCPRPVDVPIPEHALEVDYTAHGVWVVAVRASFGDPRTASRFFGTRTRLLRGCERTVISKSEGMLVDEVRRLSATALLNDRTPDSDPWTELAVHDGDQVVLLAAQTRIDRAPLTADTVADLVTAFRR